MSSASRAVDDPTAHRARVGGAARAAGGVLLGLFAFTDVVLLSTQAQGAGFWAPIAVLLLGLAAVLWPARRRPGWLTPAVRAGVPAVASLAVTAGLTARHVPGAFGPGEILILLCLLVVAIRGARPWPAAATATALGAAIVTQPIRVPVTLGDTATTYAVITVLALIVLGVAALSGYLRSLDQRRLTALAELRRAEKLATAADLHDFVAHHVTGILVQAQMARMLVDSEPERLAPILAGIEHAAAQALDSMRRTVTLLRADANPAYDLAAVPDLVSTFRHSLGPAGPAVTFRQDPDVPGDLPPEIQAAAFRVIQEALTNARTHAANATRVDIELRYDKQGLHITACDDGTPDAAPPHPGRGFGLLGLTERVTALNGSLDAGPRPTGGWRLAAVVPPPAG